jgi:hypothetical protein
MSMQLDKIIHDANGEISNLRSKMSSMYSFRYSTKFPTDPEW